MTDGSIKRIAAARLHEDSHSKPPSGFTEVSKQRQVVRRGIGQRARLVRVTVYCLIGFAVVSCSAFNQKKALFPEHLMLSQLDDTTLEILSTFG
jgi:hypothetical protein